MQNWNDDPAVKHETQTVTEVSFIADMDGPHDMPVLGGVEISFCYFMRGSVAVVSKSEIEYTPEYINDKHVQDEIENHMHPTVVEFIM